MCNRHCDLYFVVLYSGNTWRYSTTICYIAWKNNETLTCIAIFLDIKKRLADKRLARSKIFGEKLGSKFFACIFYFGFRSQCGIPLTLQVVQLGVKVICFCLNPVWLSWVFERFWSFGFFNFRVESNCRVSLWKMGVYNFL